MLESGDAAPGFEARDAEGKLWNRVFAEKFNLNIDEDGRIEQALYGIKAGGHVASLRELIGVAV